MSKKTPELLDDVDEWENRALGASEEHVAVAPRQYADDTDEQLGLQAISIRLPKSLIRDLKEIAARYDLGYQPMVRDLLNRFAVAEQKKYFTEQLGKYTVAEERSQEDTVPVSEFIAGLKRQA